MRDVRADGSNFIGGLALGAAAILYASTTSAIAAESDPAPPTSDSRVTAVIDAILDQHIDPPTRQEMILFGVKSVYEASGKTPPKGLSRRVSELSTEEEIGAYLESVRAQFELAKDFESQFIGGIFRAVPGGGVLVRPKEAAVQEQLDANRYVGIGIALGMEKDRPIIRKVIYDGPGWKEGVKAEDVILEIDGQDTSGKELSRIVDQLRGEEGSPVALLLQQAGAEPRRLTVIRGVTFIPTIEGTRRISEGQWKYTVDSAPEIACLRFNRFGPSTVHELKKIEAHLRQEKIEGVVLDLRFGGGILHDVVMVADQLLDQGTIGFVRSLDSVVKHEALPGSLFGNLPLAVLIGENANADRVYLTAALQDQNRAVVVGEPTRGPTFVRSRVELAGGDKMVIATGLLQRGDGTPLHRPAGDQNARFRVMAEPAELLAMQKRKKPRFIVPDYLVQLPLRKMNPAEEEQKIDPMLAKAIEVLRDGRARQLGERESG